MRAYLFPLLANRSFITILLIINIIGTIYGFYWYKWQLIDTPLIFLPFVPDSPTATLFFVFVLFAFLLRKNWPLIEALALVTLFKYGIWAVVMNILVMTMTGNYNDYIALMLIASHLGMAVQGVLYAPFYRIKLKHLVVAAIWTLHNDVIDYVFFMMPRYQMLDKFSPQIGYFTFWLSIVSILIAYLLCVRKNRFTLNIT